MRYTALAVIWPALIVLAAPADRAAAQSSNLYDGGGSVKIPYASGGVAESPTLHLSFDGADGPPVAFVMDTGSVGIIASPDNFTPGPNARNLGPGVQIYTSSGRVENGTWYTAQQFIYRGDTLVAVAEVPVLQVTSVTCLPDARDCQPSDHPTGIALMGIGFARENTTQPDPATHGPDYNAFLNLTQVRLTPDGPLQPLPADWHTGYVVTSEGVELGLTADNTAGAGLIKLLPDPTYSTPRHTEWVATPMVIDVNGASGAGTVLFDTGVGYGILTPPDGAPLGSLVPCPPPISNSDCLPDGAVIAVSLPGDTDPTAFYTFTVGDGTNPMAPANVAIFEATTGVFFNTSRHALTGLAYIFDSEHGFVGYRWLDTEGTTGSVRLAMALQGPFALPPGFRSELETILFAPTTLSPDGSSEFAGPILGPGGLTIDGRGKVVLSGTGTYSGPTTVSRGTLLVNGSILSPVTVERGGALGGSGLVGNDVTVLAGGIYAPGNSIGTQTVTGNFILESGAVFEVEVEPSGTSDRTIVTGSVDLTGAILKVLAAPGRYTPDTQYLIVDNQGTDPVIGRFARVNVNSPFLRPSVLYDGGTGNDVVLLLASDPGAFVDVARTRNERAVARALSGSEPDSALVESILPLSAAEANGAFNALSGEIHATVAGVLADDSRYLREAILGRLVQAGAAGSGDAELASLAAAGPQVAALDRNAMALGSDAASEEMSAPRGTLAVWTRAYGAWGDFDGNLNAAGAERDLGGFVSGIDASLGGAWRLGLAAGGSWSTVSVAGRHSRAEVESVHLAAYAGGIAGRFALRGGGAWSFSDVDTSRAVSFPGFLEREQASYDADTGQLFGEAAYPVALGRAAFEPFAGLAYVSVDTGGFKETGALAGLRGSGDGQDVGYSTFGLRAAATYAKGGATVTPHVSAAWQHAFADIDTAAALVFASTGTGFGVAGVPLAEDTALIEAGLDFNLGRDLTAALSYSGQFGDGVRDNAIKGRATWQF